MQRHISLSRFSFFFCFTTLITILNGGPRTPVHAATFTVDRTDDNAGATACDDTTPNDCSLRGAIIKANTMAGADIIECSSRNLHFDHCRSK